MRRQPRNPALLSVLPRLLPLADGTGDAGASRRRGSRVSEEAAFGGRCGKLIAGHFAKARPEMSEDRHLEAAEDAIEDVLRAALQADDQVSLRLCSVALGVVVRSLLAAGERVPAAGDLLRSIFEEASPRAEGEGAPVELNLSRLLERYLLRRSKLHMLLFADAFARTPEVAAEPFLGVLTAHADAAWSPFVKAEACDLLAKVLREPRCRDTVLAASGAIAAALVRMLDGLTAVSGEEGKRRELKAKRVKPLLGLVRLFAGKCAGAEGTAEVFAAVRRFAEATGSKPAQALLASEQPASDGASKKRGSDGESPEGPSRKKGKRAKKQKGGK